ncbi:MAG: ABC transporter ATP-binding protein [Rhodospirillales bacterium]|nr:ABC transporter ATP-binding protein [Rhodospirillales bacterium]
MLLAVEGLHAHYQKSHVLDGVDLTVERGEIVALRGRNGSGRSTLLKAIMGLVAPSAGSVRLGGRDLAGLPAHRIARAGLAYVPEERLVFDNLSVEENLATGQQAGVADAPRWTVEEMYEFFPRLRERRDTKAGYLSGGEQQMLTICRSLLGNPRLIMIDEPTEGLAPKIVEAVTAVIRDIRRRGVGVLLVEQKMTIALKVAERVLIMGRGQIVFEGTPEALRDQPEVRRAWLEVG